MRALNADALTADNLHQVFRQSPAECFPVAFLGVVLTCFHGIQDRFIAAAKTDFGIDPGAAKRSAHGTGNFLVRLAEPDQLRFKFSGEAGPLQALLVEIRLQVSPLYVRSGVLVSLLSVSAGFDETFQYTDSIIFVHNKPPQFGCVRAVRVWRDSAARMGE